MITKSNKKRRLDVSEMTMDQMMSLANKLNPSVEERLAVVKRHAMYKPDDIWVQTNEKTGRMEPLLVLDDTTMQPVTITVGELDDIANAPLTDEERRQAEMEIAHDRRMAELDIPTEKEARQFWRGFDPNDTFWRKMQDKYKAQVYSSESLSSKSRSSL
jgi:hypothetical protein